jgi:hypothetical protein
MSGATATATQATAKAAEKQKAAPSLIDEIMAKTTDLRTVMGAKWGVPKDQIIRYVRSFIGLWKGAPEGYELPWEVAIQFLTVCRELDLNPAKKECAAFFNPEKQGLQTFVMVDGWLTMANRHPAYDGYEFKHERDPRGTLERLFEQRAPLYTEVAEIVVDTDGRKVKAVVDQICHQLGIDGVEP